MNIFYLHSDPKVCASMHTDVHSYKMINESCQMLTAAHRILDGDEWADEVGLVALSHPNHPSTRWARKTAANYHWLWLLMCGLCEQYYIRYGSRKKQPRQHDYSKYIDLLLKLPDNIPYGDFSAPPLAMPDQYQCADPIQSYRNYYIAEKVTNPRGTYKFTEAPAWISA